MTVTGNGMMIRRHPIAPQALRWPDGFVGRRCEHQEAWHIGRRQFLDYKGRRVQVNLMADTNFHTHRRAGVTHSTTGA